MRSQAFAAALIGAVLISRAASAWAAAPSDACSLLTQAGVSAALGAPAGAGEHIGNSQSLCEWDAQQGKRVTLTIFQATDSQSPVGRFDQGKTPLNGVTMQPVGGVGDDAYYTYFTSMTRALGLVVKKGGFVFEVRVYGFPLEQGKTISRNLAQDVAGKV